LTLTHIIHHAWGLTFDHLTFNDNGVVKHDLTYTILFKNQSKKHLCLLLLLLNNFLQIDGLWKNNGLIKNNHMIWNIDESLKSYWVKYVIIQFLNNIFNIYFFKKKHPNLLWSQSFNLKKIQNISTNQETFNVISNKFHIFSSNNKLGIIIIFDKTMSLPINVIITHFGGKFITSLFKKNIQEVIYIVVIYESPKIKISYFNFVLKTIFKKIPSKFSIMIIGDFNILFNKNKLIINTTKPYNKYI